MTTLSNNHGQQTRRRILNRTRIVGLLFATLLCLIFQTIPLHATINVVSYWRLGEGDLGAAVGATVTNTADSVGANNLQFQGNASYANDVARAAATHTGSSLSVNFTNSAYATSAIVSTNTDNFGIECWVKPTAPGGSQFIVYNGSTGGLGDGGWGIFAVNGIYEALFGGVTVFGAAPVATNVWTHLALVRASGVASLYVNGVPVATNNATPGVPTAGGFALAAAPQSPGSPFFTGLMDEVRVFTFSPGQFSPNDLLLNQPPFPRVMAPVLTVNGNNPLFLKHQTWVDPGATVHAFPSGVAASFFYSLALKADGTVIGWGDNSFGQVNIPASATNVVAIAAGYYFGLALKAHGTVIGWEDDSSGEINVPASATNVVAIAAGEVFSLALKADGTVIGWGDNTYGQINLPTSAANVVAIAAGDAHSLALKADGTVIGWGYNYNGQTNIPASATNVVAIAAGASYSLALKADGTVIGWGDNYQGQINIPASATNVIAIAAGEYHSLALRSDGTVIGWGDNSYGQINIPTSAANVVAIAAGGYHSLALKADGSVIGWGDNYQGQLNIPPGVDIVNLPVTSIDNVDTNMPGSYQVNYFVTNAYGFVTTTSRTVLVIDSPTISNPSASLVATNAVNHLRTARFSASINPNGSPTIVSIAYGATAGYGAVSSSNILPGIFTSQTTTIDVLLSPGFTFHWQVVATNGMDSIPGSAFSPDQLFAVPAAFLLGDANGDGIVDPSELNVVYTNYLQTSPGPLMTSVAGVGGRNVSFALSNSLLSTYSVEVSTNLINWQYLGPATQRYLFTDTNAPAAPQRFYRLSYP